MNSPPSKDKALRRTLDMLSAMIEASPAAILTFTPDFRVVTWNKAAEQMFGWTAEETIGAPPPCVPQDWQEKSRLISGRVLRGETITGLEVEGQRKDGQRIALSLSTSPLHDHKGGITGIVGILLDITSHKRAEEALDESESRFRTIFDQAAVGMTHVSLGGRFLRVNRRFCEIVGHSEEELLRLTFQEITHPGDLAEDLERAQRLPAGEADTFTMEKRYIRKDRSIVWVNLTVSMLRSASGEPMTFIGVVEDITERRRAQEALRKSEERFRQVVENAPDGILVQANLQLQYLNPAAVRMFGAESASQLLGRSIVDVVHPDDRAAAVERSAQIYSRVAAPMVERRFLRMNGETFPVEVSGAPIEYDQRPAALVFFRDITERKRTEEERAKLEQQLRQAQKMESVGRLAGGVAHDFNNHLTVINGYCDMLLGRLDPNGPSWADVEEIRAAGDRAAALTQQLLTFSRQQIAAPKAINLNDVVAESGKMLRRLIGDDIEIATRLDAGLGAVMADPGQISQVLMNLAINARDAMPSGGKIVIETSNTDVDESAAARHPDARPGPCALLSVADTGVGMSQDTMQKIFEPFFTTKGMGVGTGLGLPTVYGIVRQSGGWVQVQSQPGQGSTFQIYLPRIELAAGALAAPGPVAEALDGSETVLVVEDQPKVRRLTMAILKQHGYRLLEAANGSEALALARRSSGPLHLLITDVVMPGMTGRELADRLVELCPRIKVLYTSGYAADAIAHQGMLDPGVAYLAKPFTAAQLSAKVREVLGEGLPEHPNG